jgi:hypothetical protein
MDTTGRDKGYSYNATVKTAQHLWLNKEEILIM